MNWRRSGLWLAMTVTGSGFPRALRSIRTAARLQGNERQTYVDEQLQILLAHAWENVPYYRRILGKAGVVTDGMVQLEHFAKLPLLTKEIIRDQGGQLHSLDATERGAYPNSSGGSTGEPVRFLQDKEYFAWSAANKQYYKELSGQRLGDPEVRLWGSERDILEGKESVAKRLQAWLQNRHDLNAFRMGDKEMAAFVQRWNRVRPTWVEAYVQSMYLFAQYVERQGVKLHVPRGILVSAGVLAPEVKAYIERVVGCKVLNRYGSREVSDMAYDAAADGTLQVSWWNQYVEVLNDNGEPAQPGETGRVCVTNLRNLSMPLIRYEIGDRATMIDRYTLGKIVGREVELFVTADGTKIDGEYFTHLFYLKDWVQHFQVVQKTVRKVVCSVVLRGEVNKAEQDEITHGIHAVLGKETVVEWKFVKHIPPTKSGKHLYTLSEVKQ